MSTAAGRLTWPNAFVRPRWGDRKAQRAAAGIGAGALLLGSAWIAASAGRGLTPSGGYALGAQTLAGPLGGLGGVLPTSNAVLVDAVVAVMGLGYAVLFAAAPALHARTVLVVLGCTVLLFTVCGPLLSSDVFGYADYARLAVVHHLNPYLSPPLAAPGDPFYPLVFWTHQTSPYGPLFTLITEPLAIAPALFTVWSLKLLAGLSVLASVALVGWTAERLGRSAARARVLVGGNPILLIWGVGGAHNDLIVMVFVSAAVLLVVSRRPGRAGAAFGVAVALKLTGGLALPFALIAARRRTRLVVGFAAASLPIWGVAFALFGPHLLDQVIAVATQATYDAPRSLPDVLSTAHGRGPSTSLRFALGLVLLASVAAATLGVLRGRLDWPSAAGWVGVSALVCLPATQVWYLAWVLPLAALASSSGLRVAVVVLSAAMLAANLGPVTQ